MLWTEKRAFHGDWTNSGPISLADNTVQRKDPLPFSYQLSRMQQRLRCPIQICGRKLPQRTPRRDTGDLDASRFAQYSAELIPILNTRLDAMVIGISVSL